MTIPLDITIIGGGVIGLAIARQLSLTYPRLSIVVFEKEKQPGFGISSRSSEVIHAGLYYPRHYLKSILCVRGRKQLYQYCREHQVPHQKTGKIVVAQTEEEHEFLHALAMRAALNGVDDLVWLRRSALAILEPAIQARGAFLSPSTGIIDSTALLRSLEKEALDRGVMLVSHTRVQVIEPAQGLFTLFYKGHQDDTLSSLRARVVINAAGLHAVDIATSVAGFPSHLLPEMQLAKGHYFVYNGKNPFRHLVYPVPMGQPMTSPDARHTGLGIHATLNLQGQLRFGPDVEMVTTEHYHVDEQRKPAFIEAIRRYFPALDEEKLQPAYAGIRPRLITGNQKTPDFILQGAAQHGLPGLINLFGLESPGLTACLAVAEQVGLELTAHLE